MSSSPTEHRVHVNGIDLACFEWGRRDDRGTILLAHATGFHARCWDEVVRLLGDRHVIAVDQRGHGRSTKTPITHWRVFGEDLTALVDALELRDVLGVGHSMGGHAMVDAAAVRPRSFSRLILVDPVIAAPEHYRLGHWNHSDGKGGAHPTAKRRRHFRSAAEMVERFRGREPYSVFRPAALHDYCTHGLLPAEDGHGFVLACPPEIEAAIYMASLTNAAVYDSIRSLDLPVLILRAKEPPPDRHVMDFASSPTWPQLVHQFRHGREVHFADRTHFLPMEIPQEVASRIVREAEAAAPQDPRQHNGRRAP